MRKMINIEKIKSSLLKKIKRSKFNKFFEYNIVVNSIGGGYTVYLCDGIEIGLSEHEVMIFLHGVGIMFLFEKTIPLWGEMDLEISHLIVYEKYLDDMSYEDLTNLLYEMIELSAGASKTYFVRDKIYSSNKYHNTYYYDVYINNYYSLPSNKKLGNITFHVNETKNENILIGDYQVLSRLKNDIMRGEILDAGNQRGFDYNAKDQDKFFESRAVGFVRESENGKVTNSNDNGAVFIIIRSKYGTEFRCRNFTFFLRYRYDDEQSAQQKSIVEIKNYIIDKCEPINYCEEAARIRLLLTGAGDISFEERLDKDGKLTGYDIYVEKEYDESYTREYDNITFHVNDGYVHKSEQERLADYLADNKDMIITVQDIVKLIMHPLQVTKASRFLCYRLEDQETATPIIYFNGKEGDFYLKAYGDMLVLHCRDMAIIFNANGTLIDDSQKADMCIEDDDFIMLYKDETSKNMIDIFSVVYEMIFIMAGAGEVNHEIITAEHSGNRYVITLEKEYIKPYSRSFGNIAFDIREEKY